MSGGEGVKYKKCSEYVLKNKMRQEKIYFSF